MYKLTDTQIQTVIQNASRSLFEYCKKYNIHYTITGVSGGIDSAVTFALAGLASEKAKENKYKLNHVGLILPCHTDTIYMQRAEEIIHQYNGIKVKTGLSEVYEYIEENVLPDIDQQITMIKHTTDDEITSDFDQKIAKGNIKARLRMMLGTYHVAKLLNGIVLSTDNYSEYLMGFWTICGDVGDYAMIQKVFKGLEIYDIAKALNVPKTIINAQPDDGLGIQKGGDEAQLGASYKTVDKVMIQLIINGFDPNKEIFKNLPKISGVTPKTIKSLWERSKKYRFKRKGTVVLERKDLGLEEIEDIQLDG